MNSPSRRNWNLSAGFIRFVSANEKTMTIKNETEYENASERADEIYGAKKGTPEHTELQELLKALKDYEDDFVRMLKDND
jgi:acyl-homoserine lactone acylase PvdQ